MKDKNGFFPNTERADNRRRAIAKVVSVILIGPFVAFVFVSAAIGDIIKLPLTILAVTGYYICMKIMGNDFYSDDRKLMWQMFIILSLLVYNGNVD